MNIGGSVILVGIDRGDGGWGLMSRGWMKVGEERLQSGGVSQQAAVMTENFVENGNFIGNAGITRDDHKDRGPTRSINALNSGGWNIYR